MLNPNQLEEIFLKAVERIEKYPVDKNFLKAAMSSLLITFLSCKFQLIVKVIEEKQLFEFVNNYIFNQTQIYSNPYDRKVRIIVINDDKIKNKK